MEYIVGLALIAAAYYAFFRKKEETVAEAAPYKVEVPEAKVEVVNAQPVVKEEAKPVKKAPAKKPAAKKVAAKKPAVKKAPAKKPKA